MEKTIEYQQASISYRIIGKGKTVMLVHGFGEDSNVWDAQVAFLKDHFRLIVPDIPGSGRSQIIKNADLETYAEVLKQILDNEISQISAAEKELVIMIGHSMGGYITLSFADKYPGYLYSFGLFHSSAFADNEEKKQTRRKAIDFIRDKGANAFLKTSTPGLFTKAYAEKFPDKINGLIELAGSISAEALVQYYEAMIVRPDRTELLKTFPGPILYIIGEFDNAVPLQASLQQCYLPKQSHVHILSASAHMGMWEETDKANQILFKFLSQP